MRLGLSIVLVLSCVATAAHANIAAAPPNKVATLTGATPEKTPLVVEREKLVFHCKEGGAGVPLCRFRAEYTIHNPTLAPVDQVAAFVGLRAPNISVTVDGRDATVVLSDDDRARIEPLALSPEERDEPGPANLQGMRFVIAPGAQSTVVATGYTLPGPDGRLREGYSLSGNRARHLVLGHDSDTDRSITYAFDYLVTPIHTWSHVGDIDVEIHFDDSWDLDVSLDTPTGVIRAGALTDHEDTKIVRLHTTGSEQAQRLRMRFAVEPWPIYNGGPFVGLGAEVIGPDAFRIRGGYEIAAPEYLVHSLSVDTNFDNHVVLTPAVEALTPVFVFFIPSFGVGAGVPVRILPDVRVGIRGQLTVGWPVVAFALSIDHYPGTTGPGSTDLTLLGRASF
jgi:hypothetical protein